MTTKKPTKQPEKKPLSWKRIINLVIFGIFAAFTSIVVAGGPALNCVESTQTLCFNAGGWPAIAVSDLHVLWIGLVLDIFFWAAVGYALSFMLKQARRKK